MGNARHERQGVPIATWTMRNPIVRLEDNSSSEIRRCGVLTWTHPLLYEFPPDWVMARPPAAAIPLCSGGQLMLAPS